MPVKHNYTVGNDISVKKDAFLIQCSRVHDAMAER